jgi:hypothetical protein
MKIKLCVTRYPQLDVINISSERNMSPSHGDSSGGDNNFPLAEDRNVLVLIDYHLNAE